MLRTKRVSAVFTALVVIAALAALGVHSTAKGGKPGGSGTTVTYTLTDLKGFADRNPYGWANGLNNPNPTTGIVEIVGASYRADGHLHAALWEVTPAGVTLTDLSAGSGLFSPSPVAVNDEGLIVGTSNSLVFVVLPGSDVLQVLPGKQPAYAVNNLGDVACLDKVLNVDADGTVTLLIEFGDYDVFYARDINDGRDMAGSQDDIPAIAWFDDPAAPTIETLSVRKLGLLPGTTFGHAIALNNLGEIVGECGESIGDGSYYPHAFLWTEADGMIALGDLGGRSSRALDINDHGQVVGWARNAGGSTRAFLWENDKMSDLNVLSAAGSKRTLDSANAINNFGHIVGSLTTSGSVKEHHAFLLTPKP